MLHGNDWNPLAYPSHYFNRIGRAQTLIGDARLRAMGLAMAQLPVLSMLGGGGRQISQIELARRARVEQPPMAQLLTRMERDGLIRRVPDPSDRRSSLIMLTDEAEWRLPAGRGILRQGNADMTQRMSGGEIEQLLSLLKRVVENVDQIEN